MLNAVGRDIPEEILKATGKEVFQGVHHFDGHVYKKHGPETRCVINSDGSKLVDSIHEVLVKCGIKDGMTLGFHHHFREGDYVVNMVMREIHAMGIKDITSCASSLGKAHDELVPMIEDGTITNIQSSGVRGKIGEAISAGKLKRLATMRSHGGRIRAIQTGETTIDISFIGAPTCDDYGNCKGTGGKSDCGVLSYSFVDGNHVNKVVAVTDCLVPFPNYPADINMTKVDYVCVVDQIGIPEKIATGAAKPTIDVRKLMMADYCTQVVVNTPYFKDGSAREQAASCQRVIGGLANITKEYATKRYRSNVMNWGMIPFQMTAEPEFEVGDYIYVPNIREALDGDMKDIKAYVVGEEVKEISLYVADMTEDEKKIVKAGCLINYNRSRK